MKLFNKDEFIANEIKFYLLKNKTKEGEKLPSERELAEIFDVQRATIRNALTVLEEEGIIEKKERSGRYMGHPRIKTNLQQIKSFSDKLNDMGIETKNKLLSFESMEVDKELSKKVKLPIGTPIYKITRVRKVMKENEKIPIAIEYAYIPEDIAPKLLKYDVEEGSLFSILINEYKVIPQKEEQTIEIVYADEFEAKNLKVDKLTALVKKSGTTYDSQGNIIQYLHSIMNKDWVEFELDRPDIESKTKEGLYGL